MREFSFQSILLGIVIGIALGAANAFVGLQVGMTISASIPAAVMSLLILRTFLKRGTLLESNMVQTVGSAGESIATGMIFALPALFILGEDPSYLEMVIWSGIGGLLGVCFMVPLRQILIVKEHGKLPYPEGVACAEVLESGERGSGGAKSVIIGTLVGGIFLPDQCAGFLDADGCYFFEKSSDRISAGFLAGVVGGGLYSRCKTRGLYVRWCDSFMVCVDPRDQPFRLH